MLVLLVFNLLEKSNCCGLPILYYVSNNLHRKFLIVGIWVGFRALALSILGNNKELLKLPAGSSLGRHIVKLQLLNHGYTVTLGSLKWP